MSPVTWFQLMAMMFLQYYVWGSWYVSMGPYMAQTLHFSGGQIGLAYSTTGIAAIIAPLFMGMIADRFFSAQKVLGILHLLGGLFLWRLSKAEHFPLYFAMLMAHTLCYMPTIALSNAVAFAQMKNAEKQFPYIRVMGTIGWIAAGLVVSFVLRADTTRLPFLMGALVSVALGFYAFLLPDTPPQKRGQTVTVGEIFGLDALRLLRNPSFAVFLAASLMICIPLSFYYSFGSAYLSQGGVQNITGVMTIGQVSETLFMLVIPVFFALLGVKYMLAAGMLAWAARYLLFTFGGPELPGLALWLLAIALHGICYDFFFVTGQIYVEKAAPSDIRGSAQGLLALVTYGIGMALGQIAAGQTVSWFTTGSGDSAAINWFGVWMTPTALALAALVFFVLFFREPAADNRPDTPKETVA